MNIKEYISSGVIEAYVLGELSAKEEAELFELSQKHAEVQDALNEAESTLFDLGQADSVEAPSSVKKDLMAKISQESESSQATAATTNSNTSYLSIAASIVAIVGIAASFYYRSAYLGSQEKLSEIITRNQQIAEEYQQAKFKAQRYGESLEILSQKDLQLVQMQGVEAFPGALANVFWNKDTKTAYLNVIDLPRNSTDKQYQLWALVDGEPVDMGVFDVREDMKKLLEMKQIQSVDAFAVTLEPRGGSENPTLDKMYVIGNLNS